MDEAAINLAKTVEHRIHKMTPRDIAALDDHWNHLRGLLNTNRLGLGPNQAFLEANATLAARYNRAVAANFADLFRGDITGREAWKNLSLGLGAIASTGVAFSLARGETPEEAAEHLIPTSPKFLTWEVAGQNVGPGSKIRSVINLLAATATNPDSLLEAGMANPALRFIRGNLAPIPSKFIDIWTGSNFIGDPTRDGMLSFTREIAAPSVMPIWTTTVLLEGGGNLGQRALRGVAEFVGFRAYETPPIQKFISYIEKQENKRYDQIPDVDRERYKRHDETAKGLWEDHLADQQTRGREPEALAEIRTAGEQRISTVNEGAGRVADGTLPYWDLRKLIQDSGQKTGAIYDHIRANPKYTRFFAEIEGREPSEIPEDEAMRRYLAIVFDPDLQDDVEGPNHVEIDRLVTDLRREIGPELWQSIQTKIALDREDFKGAAAEWFRDTEILKPYWGILEKWIPQASDLRNIYNQYLDTPRADREDYLRVHPDLRRNLDAAHDEQDRLRTSREGEQGRLFDALLVKWYGDTFTPKNLDNKRLGVQNTILWVNNTLGSADAGP